MKRKLILVVLVLILAIFLSGCNGGGVPTAPNQAPTASFTATPTSGVAPLGVAFNASNSSDSDGSITSYAWDFKDGSTGNGQSINHTFSSIGSYNVLLTVTDNEGASDSTTKTINVTETPNQSPTASFTANPTSGVAPLGVAFNASNSSDSDGSITSYAWDFKDGSTGNGQSINHTFSSIGSYNVELTITDNKGATGLDTKTIIVTTPEPTPETIFPSREEAMEIIKANAYDYWGDDYVMVQWEIDRQTEAYDWLVKQTEYPNIMSNAYDYWGDDYVMVQWEYERQVEAYEGLQ